MKLKSLLWLFCFGLCSIAQAANHHAHADASGISSEEVTSNKAANEYCDIEVTNDTNMAVSVSGTFDDYTSLIPFTIYPYEASHYISLYYYNYCHAGMYLEIRSYGYILYSGYTRVNSTLHVIPYLNKQLKVEIHAR